jgi:hypothetical protein
VTRPFLVWPIVKADAHADALYEKISNARRAMAEDESLFGLRIQAIVVQGGLPFLTHAIHWLENHKNAHRPRRRDALSALEKEAILDLLDPNPSHHIQEIMGFHTPPIKGASEKYWICGDITREGLLLSSSSVRKAGKDNDWAEAFRAEERICKKASADDEDLDIELRVSSQAATLHTPEMNISSTHEEIARLRRLKDLFSRHMARLSTLLPQDRPFEIYDEWRPPSWH